MGDAAEDIFESFKWEDQEQKTYENVKQKFQNYFSKKKNVIYERAKFNERKQKEGETVDAFITALHKLATKCDYGALNDDLIRDRIVVGIRDQGLSEKMQLDEKLTLSKATKMARESEAVRLQQSEIRDGKQEKLCC